MLSKIVILRLCRMTLRIVSATLRGISLGMLDWPIHVEIASFGKMKSSKIPRAREQKTP